MRLTLRNKTVVGAITKYPVHPSAGRAVSPSAGRASDTPATFIFGYPPARPNQGTPNGSQLCNTLRSSRVATNLIWWGSVTVMSEGEDRRQRQRHNPCGCSLNLSPKVPVYTMLGGASPLSLSAAVGASTTSPGLVFPIAANHTRTQGVLLTSRGGGAYDLDHMYLSQDVSMVLFDYGSLTLVAKTSYHQDWGLGAPGTHSPESPKPPTTKEARNA